MRHLANYRVLILSASLLGAATVFGQEPPAKKLPAAPPADEPAKKLPAPRPEPLPEPAPAPAAADAATDVEARSNRILRDAQEIARIASRGDPKLQEQILVSVLRAAYGAEDGAPIGRGVMPVPPALSLPRGVTPRARPPIPLPATTRAAAAARLVRLRDSSEVYQRNRAALLAEATRDGRSKQRIFGGVQATAGEIPSCVAVGTDFSRLTNCCSGTLVGPRIVVTAAHCSECLAAGQTRMQVYFGLDANNPDLNKVYSGTFFAHPTWNPNTGKDDIAVIVLDKAVPTTDGCAVGIATDADIHGATKVRIAGFGLTDKSVQSVLFTADAPIISYDCADVQASTTVGCNSGTELAAGGGGIDSCFGDSGGPAYVVQGTTLLLAGVTSRGCADSPAGQPCGSCGVYTRADKYLDWITRVATDNNATIGAATTCNVPGAPPTTTPATSSCANGGYSAAVLNAIEEWKKIRPDLVPK
jgi:endonuclease G